MAKGSPLRSFWEELRQFFLARKEKTWLLLVALVGLGGYLYSLRLPSPPTAARSLEVPLPPPAATLGEGEKAWGLILWWRCPACKGLVAKMDPALSGEAPWRGRVEVYFYDLSQEDRERTAYFFCREDLPPGMRLRLLYLGNPLSEEEKGAYREKPCWQKGLSWSAEAKERLQRNRVEWTPALVRGSVLQPPEAGIYERFLQEAVGR